MPALPYDIVFYDTVGTPFTVATIAQRGMGGSEFEAALLLEALAANGFRILVLNALDGPLTEGGIDYRNRSTAGEVGECGILIIQRYSPVPPIRAGRTIVIAHDIPGNHYDHFQALFAGSADVVLVAVSEWQRQQFPAHWPSRVIPNMLPDAVYRHPETTPDPRRFVYASAALKGLPETLALWHELRAHARMQDAELCVCTPGYDHADAAATAGRGVRFLGSLPFREVVDLLASSAGLFYVNTWSETFCITAAITEALGRRVHVLCRSDPGGLAQTVTSPLVTSDHGAFVRDFLDALCRPQDPAWHGKAHDFSVTHVIREWLDLLRAPPHQRPAPALARVCLSMIVKNEAHVIERCLRSVRPYIHAWAISDTGSSDGTQDIIRKFMADLPGELIERPWVDFSTNRNEALQLAERYGDYALVIDADDELEADSGFAWPRLDATGYSLEITDTSDVRYWRVALPRLRCGWEWRGVLHEALCSSAPAQPAKLPGLRILRIHNDGARSRQSPSEKFRRDADVLRRALETEPDNARYRFYLAQSLRDAGDLRGAIAEYEKRAAMGGWTEEVYFSRFQVAVLKERSGVPYAEVVAAYLDACDSRPTRAEAPCELARYFRLHERWNLARHFAQIAVSLPVPDDLLFIDRAVHDWRARDELSIAAYWCGDYARSAALCRELLASPHLPEGERQRVQKNLEFALPHLAVQT